MESSTDFDKKRLEIQAKLEESCKLSSEVNLLSRKTAQNFELTKIWTTSRGRKPRRRLHDDRLIVPESALCTVGWARVLARTNTGSVGRSGERVFLHFVKEVPWVERIYFRRQLCITCNATRALPARSHLVDDTIWVWEREGYSEEKVYLSEETKYI